ncbi:MAG: hypothetical protein ACRDPY_45580, partial [Streptosporangiaceae bacterium]
RYDTERGISYWTKNYRTGIEQDDDLATSREYPYYDPIYMLPESGQDWWRAQDGQGGPGRPVVRRGGVSGVSLVTGTGGTTRRGAA